MHKTLAPQFERLEAERRALLERVSALSQTQVSYQPDPTAWSICQVIGHLVIAEEGTRRVLETAPPPEARVTLRGKVVLHIIYVVFALGLRVKAPSRRLISDPGVPLDELVQRWSTARAGIITAVAALPSTALGEPRFKHPLAGWLPVQDGLRFLGRHIAHHRRQVGRICRAPGFPAAERGRLPS